MTERLQKKVDRAIRLLQSIPTEDDRVVPDGGNT